MSSTVMDSRKRSGLLGEKVGMTQVWDDVGRLVPVTVVRIGPNVVTQVRTPDKDGYSAIQLGVGEVDPRKVNKPQSGHFAKAGVTPRRHLVELRTADASEYTVGDEIPLDVFAADQLIDVTATSKGKGFAGVMKRHGFHGLSATHGAERKQRMPGAIGGAAYPARVFKGQKMAGRMGNVRTTVQNLEVHDVDAEEGIVYLRGAIPGANGSVVLVRTAAKVATRNGDGA